jgi:hypothetical protein
MVFQRDKNGEFFELMSVSARVSLFRFSAQNSGNIVTHNELTLAHGDATHETQMSVDFRLVVQKTSAYEFPIQGVVGNSMVCRWIGSVQFFDSVAGPAWVRSPEQNSGDTRGNRLISTRNFLSSFTSQAEKFKIQGFGVQSKGCFPWVQGSCESAVELIGVRDGRNRLIVDHDRIFHFDPGILGPREILFWCGLCFFACPGTQREI